MAIGLVARFERSVLFRIARGVALAICTVFFVLLVCGLVYLFKPADDSDKLISGKDYIASTTSAAPKQEVHGDTITRIIQEAKGERIEPDVKTTLKIPASMQERFSTEEAQKSLEAGLADVSSEYRQDCLDGIGELFAVHPEGGDQLGKLIDGYIAACRAHDEQVTASRAAVATAKTYMATLVLSSLLIIALFSLVLVLIAIERNTRPAEAAGK